MLLIRVWIALHRTETDPVPEFLHHIEPVVPTLDGGSSSRGRSLEPGWFDFGFDLDELWFVFLAIACALGGLIAIAYVVYIAPVLLAEVALDAALLTTVYRRLRREDVSWWPASVFRRTWVPAMILTIFMGATGWALQQIAPDARSVGGVVRELMSEGGSEGRPPSVGLGLQNLQVKRTRGRQFIGRSVRSLAACSSDGRVRIPLWREMLRSLPHQGISSPRRRADPEAQSGTRVAVGRSHLRSATEDSCLTPIAGVPF